MPQELVHLNLRQPAVRIALILLLLVAAVWSYFAVRWYTGNTLAEYFNPAQNNLQIAEMAKSLAPKDPLTHWRRSEEHTSELQSQSNLVCRLLLEKKKKKNTQ